MGAVIGKWAGTLLMVAGAFMVAHTLSAWLGWDRVSQLEDQVIKLTDALNGQIEWRNTGVLMERPASFWDVEDQVPPVEGGKKGVVR